MGKPHYDRPELAGYKCQRGLVQRRGVQIHLHTKGLPYMQDNAKYLLFIVVKDVGALPKREERLHPFLEVFEAWYYCTSKCS